ncbi:MAG: HypC/HybG/HupF family hydrogenase formation chaperone [Candidatus Acidiferrales bacterium]
MDSNENEMGMSGGCHMCLAIPGKIVEISDTDRNSASVDVLGVRRRVDLGLLEDDKPVTGDWVLIHVGFAMSKIGEQDAIDQMRTLAMLGETEAALQEVQGYGSHDQDDKRTSAQPATSATAQAK